MAKGKSSSAETIDNSNSSEESPRATNGGRALPAGYTSQSSDLVGFWDSEIAENIHFIPRYAKLMDSQIDSKKTSILIVGELFEDCVLVMKEDGEKETVDGKKGNLVGVWAKPGMRDLKNLANVPVFMFQEGEKEVGKPNPMKLYGIFSKTKGRMLKVTEDTREDSKGVPTFLTMGSTLPDAPF